MKLIKSIVRPNKVDDVKDALAKLSLAGLTVTEVRGHGKQKGHTAIYRGKEYNVSLLPKMEIEVVVSDAMADEAIKAIMAAAHYRVDSLTLIVDHNGAQQSNLVPRVVDYRPLAAKLRAFDWHVEEVDGHDMASILRAFASTRALTGRPQAIVAHTVKGKGVSFVEADWTYHGKPLPPAERDRAHAELGVG